MPTITPFLWFDTQAEEAMNHYVSIFKDAKVLDVSRNGDTVFSVRFSLKGQEFIGLNGGPLFKFNESISFSVDCADQKEVDYYWERLGEGGEFSQCGWLKDRFGLSWQIVPRQLGQLLGNPDPVKAGKVMQAMLQMAKLDIAGLEAAAK